MMKLQSAHFVEKKTNQNNFQILIFKILIDSPLSLWKNWASFPNHHVTSIFIVFVNISTPPVAPNFQELSSLSFLLGISSKFSRTTSFVRAFDIFLWMCVDFHGNGKISLNSLQHTQSTHKHTRENSIKVLEWGRMPELFFKVDE